MQVRVIQRRPYNRGILPEIDILKSGKKTYFYRTYL
jgi:hypothetical protein